MVHPQAETEHRLRDIQRRVDRLLQRLDNSFLERQSHTRLALLSLITGHHMLMLGPPGTAKSLLARAVCQCIDGGRYFEYLLSRFTHPDELFGPVSIPGLKQEDYRRLTEGYLPDAHVAFLDEVFKANSAILNSLLTLINERVFHHGVHRDHVPLLALIGASNEPPDSDLLAALYDRFLVRTAVQPLASQENFLRVCLGEVEPFEPPPQDPLTLEDIAWIRRERVHVTASPAARQTLVRLREALHNDEIPTSDRRWRWALELVQVATLTSGRRIIEPVDLLLLQHCFGTPFETDAQVQRIVGREVLGGVHPVFDIQALQDMAATLRQPPAANDRFTALRQRRLDLVDQLAARCDTLERAVERRRQDVLDEDRRSIWLHEIPPEVYTAMLAARTTLRDAIQPVRAMIASYRPRLRSVTLVGRFFGAFVLQNQLFSMLLRDDDRTPVAWVSGPHEPPQRWAALMEDGKLVMDAEPFIPKHTHTTPWHEAVFHVELNDDVLFEICRRDDWEPVARSWFAKLWSHHPNPDGTPDHQTTAAAFLAMLEHFRLTATVDPFPLPDDE